MGGEEGFVGNGFKLRASAMSDSALSKLTTAAKASLTCGPEVRAPALHPKRGACTSRLMGGFMTLNEIDTFIAINTVAVFGWNSCPCTAIANGRFTDGGVCYDTKTWDSSSEPVMKFLGCLYGDQHHSFIFMGQTFIDNGFRFALTAMGKPELDGILTSTGASTTCGPTGDPFFEDYSRLLSHNPAQKVSLKCYLACPLPCCMHCPYPLLHALPFPLPVCIALIFCCLYRTTALPLRTLMVTANSRW
jgi:hypothetical protein